MRSVTMMSQSWAGDADEDQENQLDSDQDLPEWIYYLSCFGYLALIGVAAILIEDLTLIFGIIAGLAECCTVFLLPSIFYLKACSLEEKKFANVADSEREPLLSKGGEQRKKRLGGGLFTKMFVVVFMAIGLCYFCTSNYFLMKKIFKF